MGHVEMFGQCGRVYDRESVSISPVACGRRTQVAHDPRPAPVGHMRRGRSPHRATQSTAGLRSPEETWCQRVRRGRRPAPSAGFPRRRARRVGSPVTSDSPNVQYVRHSQARQLPNKQHATRRRRDTASAEFQTPADGENDRFSGVCRMCHSP